MFYVGNLLKVVGKLLGLTFRTASIDLCKFHPTQHKNNNYNLDQSCGANMNKMTKFTASVIALAVTTAFAAQAADNRYIIKVDNNKKGIVKALAHKLGGELKVDGRGFIAATFSGKSLSQVKGLLNNPHIQLIEEDVRRVPLSIYSDDIGKLTPYAVAQSQADQLAFNANAGMKVCVIDSGLDASNPDIYRNGSLFTTTANDGAYTNLIKGSGTFTYKVCDQGTSNCSAEVSVNL